MTSQEAHFKEAKFHDIQNYIRQTGHRIEYNGAGYHILEGDNVITCGETTEEIYSYIVGWQNAYKILGNKINELEETLKVQTQQNDMNIKMYEKLLHDAGVETLQEFSKN